MGAIEAFLQSAHVGGGAAALFLGPVALSAPKRIGWHSRVGEAFFAVVTITSVSGGALAVMHWETRAFFQIIAAGTFASAFAAYMAAKKRWRNWLLVHVAGQGSAYTAMVTAFIVAMWADVTGTEGTDEPLVFLVPMFIGCVAFGWLLREVYRGRRPRRPIAEPPGD